MKWEYAVESFNRVSEGALPTLERMGQQGWELVAILQDPPFTRLVFKRPKQ